MAENTGISWAHHTINFWWGCSKVSPACQHCYAERLDARFNPHPHPMADPGTAAHWGPKASRLLRVEAATKEAFRYQRRVVKEGRRFRVFTNSMADFFEDRRDLDEARLAALDVIRQTPNLDWLILTKRPERIMDLLKQAEDHAWRDGRIALADTLANWLCGEPPANVWLGTTAENQEWADKRIPELLKVPAAVRFLSCEPLLGPLELPEFCACGCGNTMAQAIREAMDSPMAPNREQAEASIRSTLGLDWVIVGGESGPHARPMHPGWARGLRDQCAAAAVPFHFKQWGEWAPDCLCGTKEAHPTIKRPEPGHPGCMFRCGTKAAGRLLDGVFHDAVPEVPHV